MRVPNLETMARWHRRRLEHRSRREAEVRVARSLDTPGAIGKQTLLTLLPTNPVILEVGSHTGGDTEEFAVMYPMGQVWAFEADPGNFIGLCHRTAQYPNVHRTCAAVGDRSGVSIFHGSSGASDGSGSLLTPTLHEERHPDVVFPASKQHVVPVIVLDEFAEAAGLDRVNLIWIDAQGAELMVLGSAPSVLSRTDLVYAEVSQDSLYAGGATYDDLRAFMDDHGFRVEKEYRPAEWLGDGNVLFRRDR